MTIVPREVTESEIAHFTEHGWVYLESYFSRSDADQMLEELRKVMGLDATRRHPDSDAAGRRGEMFGRANQFGPLSVRNTTGEVESQFFYEISHSDEMGRNLAALSGSSLRYFVDEGFVKRPIGSGDGSDPTPWHRDVGAEEDSPFDPPHGQAQLWLALVDVPPERGGLRFVAPKDIDEEVLAIVDASGFDGPYSDFLNDTYKKLENKSVISPARTLKAGDATVHGSATLHSAPANHSQEPRWVYVLSTFPEATLFSGRANWPIEGVEGMEAGKPFVDHRYRVLASESQMAR